VIGRVIRPKAVVLPDSALLSNRFTHEVIAAQPYFRAAPTPQSRPAGVLAKGTQVVLIEHLGGPMCRVVDQRGTPFYTAFAGLRALVSG
jgi:hypothetical protein